MALSQHMAHWYLLPDGIRTVNCCAPDCVLASVSYLFGKKQHLCDGQLARNTAAALRMTMIPMPSANCQFMLRQHFKIH